MFRRHREGREAEDTSTRYRMRQQLLSFGDDFYIENDRGERVFHVDGKALRIRHTQYFDDMQGHHLCEVQERMLRVKDTINIESDGHTVATVKKALIDPIRDRYTIKIRDGEDMNVHGNILDHEYTIERGGRTVAEVSMKWFRVADTYGVEIAPGEEDVLILAATAAIDTMAHPGR